MNSKLSSPPSSQYTNGRQDGASGARLKNWQHSHDPVWDYHIVTVNYPMSMDCPFASLFSSVSTNIRIVAYTASNATSNIKSSFSKI